jgi:acetyl-CoA synthetase
MKPSYQISTREDYFKAYSDSIEDPETFWSDVAAHFKWKKKWDKVLEWDFHTPEVKWFIGASLNITENCLDRHLEVNGETPAIIWEPNDPAEKTRTLTYRELHQSVCTFSNALKNNGVKKGDRVCIYMGMIPELAVAILACARIGAVHSVIFGGFSARAIADRVEDAGAEFVITADGANRGARQIELKAIVDEALRNTKAVKKVIVYRHTQTPVEMLTGRDVWWHDEIAKVQAAACPAEATDAEDLLFILYTSGSTGKPKGVVHSCAGYMVWAAYTFSNVFQYKKGDVHFCTADIGWITGHSYILYGPLCEGATTLMFEGIPTWPDAGRFWKIVDKHNVNILYTAPTAIRSLMAYGTAPFEGTDLSSLKVLGSVGEPINEEAWHWFHKNAGKKNCPIVDTWWQTETGGIMISNLAGITPGKPSFATFPLPGVQPCLVDEQGRELTGNNTSGNLCIKFPWPGMVRTTYKNHERFRNAYFTTYPGKYFTGDGCLRDEEGNYRITGRVDDVINVSGHRIGTAEVENAINSHPDVVESAVVPFPHDIKGQAIYAFIITSHAAPDAALKNSILQTVADSIGAFAKADKIQFVPGLPKTRSGKIMRRILRKIAEGETASFGDTSTLLDPDLVEVIKHGKV